MPSSTRRPRCTRLSALLNANIRPKPALSRIARLEPLESRTLLSAALPGMHLAEPFAGQTVYLDFDGAADVTYRGPITVRHLDIPAFAPPPALANERTEVIRAVLNAVQQIYADTGVQFALGSSPRASTVFVGPAGGAFAPYGSFLGLAEKVDSGNTDPADNAFVFSDQLSQTDPYAYAQALSQVIAHETGHLLGYAHDDASHTAGPLDAVAATYTSTFRSAAKIHQVYDAPLPHTFKVIGFFQDSPAVTMYVTKWFVNNGYVGIFSDSTSSSGNGWADASLTYDFTGKPHATTISIKAQVNDTNLNVVEEHIWTFTVDAQGPTAPNQLDMTPSSSNDTGKSPNDDITRNTNPEFRWNKPADRGGAGTDDAYDWVVLAGGGQPTTSTPLNRSSSNTVRTGFLLDGFYRFWVRAIDKAKNIGDWASLPFTIDTVAPGMPTLLNPTNGSTVRSTTPTLSWSPIAITDLWQYSISLSDRGSPRTDNRSGTSTSPQWQVAPPLTYTDWWWQVIATDVAGNPSPPSVTWRFTAAPAITTAPTGVKLEPLAANDTGMSSTDGITSNDRPKFVWTAPSVPTGIDYYEYQLDGLFIRSTGSDQAFWQPGLTDSPIAEGSHTIKFRVVEGSALHEAGEWSTPYSFTIDKTPPPLPLLLTPAAGATVLVASPKLNWSDVTDNWGFWKYHVRVSDHAGTLREADVTASEWNVTPPIDNKDWWWQVKAVDAAGNESVYTPEWSVTVDAPPPPTPAPTGLKIDPGSDSGLSSFDGLTSIDKPLFTWNAPSTTKVIAYYEYELDGGSPAATLSAVPAWKPAPLDAPIAEGTHAIRVRAVDDNLAHTTGLWSDFHSFTIDTTPPGQPALVSPADKTTLTSGLPTLRWSPIPSEPSLWQYHLYLSNTAGAVREADSFVSQWTTTEELPYGTWTWKVSATDQAGNVGIYSDPWQFTVPAKPLPAPTALKIDPASDTGKSNADGITSIDKPLFIWTAPTIASGIDHYEYQIDAGSPVSTGSAVPSWQPGLADPAFLEGTHTFKVRVIEAGPDHLVSPWSTTCSFRIDQTPPSLPALSSPPSDGTAAAGSPTLDWSDATDAGGTWKYHVYLSDHAAAVREGDALISRWNVSPAIALGDWWWQVKAVDLAGNESAYTSEWKFTAVDLTPPTAKYLPKGSPKAGQKSFLIWVTYTDEVMVNAATVGDGDVVVYGPRKGTVLPAKLWRKVPAADASSIVAGYLINAPNGTWTYADNGTYTVYMMRRQVRDTTGNFALRGTIGTFKVNLRAPKKASSARASAAPLAQSLEGQPSLASVFRTGPRLLEDLLLGSQDVMA